MHSDSNPKHAEEIAHSRWTLANKPLTDDRPRTAARSLTARRSTD